MKTLRPLKMRRRSPRFSGRTSLFVGAALCAALTPAAVFAQYDITVIMSGLDNPRGLAIGPDGGIYVTEAGRGGNGTRVTTGDGTAQSFGATSAVSRLLGGVQSRVLTGAPSLAVTTNADGTPAPAPGNGASGLQDITFVGGQAYGLIGLGGDPAIRNSFTGTENASGARFFGHLVTLALDGSNTITSVADIAAYEAANNPAGGNPLDDVNSNPHSFVARPGGGFAVTDAGGNDVLSVSTGGVVSTLSVLPARTNPLAPFGPPVYQSVPTGIALAPDGSYYFTELTGFPFLGGAANIYRYNPITNQTTIAYSGFTNLLDVAFAPDGSLYALQISSSGLANPNGPGSGLLTRIDTAGNRTIIASQGLFLPTAMAIGADGAIYVSNQGSLAGAGQVVRITAAPEPGSIALLATGGLLSLVGLGKKLRRGRRSLSRK
jgi:hypothetical protein